MEGRRQQDEVIERALHGMVGVARSINEMRRQHENAVRVQEIQSHLYGWDGADLTTLGDLILEVFISTIASSSAALSWGQWRF